MGAFVQTKASRFASLQAIETKLNEIGPPRRPRLIPAGTVQFANHARFLKHLHCRH